MCCGKKNNKEKGKKQQISLKKKPSPYPRPWRGENTSQGLYTIFRRTRDFSRWSSKATRGGARLVSSSMKISKKTGKS